MPLVIVSLQDFIEGHLKTTVIPVIFEAYHRNFIQHQISCEVFRDRLPGSKWKYVIAQCPPDALSRDESGLQAQGWRLTSRAGVNDPEVAEHESGYPY